MTTPPPRSSPLPFKDWPAEITGAIPAVRKDGGPPQEETQKAKNMVASEPHTAEIVSASR